MYEPRGDSPEGFGDRRQCLDHEQVERMLSDMRCALGEFCVGLSETERNALTAYFWRAHARGIRRAAFVGDAAALQAELRSFVKGIREELERLRQKSTG